MSLALERAWQSMGATWRSDELRTQTLIEVLRRRVRRQTLRLQMIVAAEVLVTLFVLSLTAAAIREMTGVAALRVAVIALLYTGGVWAFALWNRRGIWGSYGESMTDCVSLLRTRAERRVRSAWFSIIVIALASVLVAVQIVAAWSAGSISAWDRAVWTTFAVYSIGLVVWSHWYLRTARRELRELDALSRDLSARVG